MGVLIRRMREASIILVQVPRDRDNRLLKFARTMRRRPTDAEIKLWQVFRLKGLADYRFRRQHRVSDYILDFYCAARRLAIELDGGQHGDPKQTEYDQRRTFALNRLGIRVLRF